MKLDCGHHELPVMTAACKNTERSFKVRNMLICNDTLMILELHYLEIQDAPAQLFSEGI